MSNEYSIALKMGTSAPFILIMALNHFERRAFIDAVSPSLLPALKRPLLKGV
ncbi:hypothetical protein [Psychromonas ossibalaenae]|uniref:hypothetical protein n=1 Tax=Psychromonas ossibalaenae TaxID=444922 RepID=UPI00037D7C55|nr:hypothetical protein [Psychromonas ossibalaenae]